MTSRHFCYMPLPSRILFGFGMADQLPEETGRLNITKALVLSTAQQAELCEAIAEKLGGRAAASFRQAVMHTPVQVTEEALSLVKRHAINGIVAAGGGSTIGLAKAIALRTGLPVIALPTTYAGSEVTPVLGETRDGEKTTIRDLMVLPKTVIYDVDLTLSMPVPLSVTSGVNAVAHAVEALYARDRNPIVELMAQEGAGALVKALPSIATDPVGREARANAFYGAWLCGTCLGQAEMGLHHKICHTLGGTFNLPHAETHSVMLPHTLAYNAGHAPEAVRRLSVAFGAADPARFLHALASSLSAPLALRELGMPEDGIARATEIALAKPYPNPRPLEREATFSMIRRAWAGEPPLPGH